MSRLREAFDEGAGRARVAPGALDAIRTRVARRARRRRGVAVGLAAAAILGLAGLTATLLTLTLTLTPPGPPVTAVPSQPGEPSGILGTGEGIAVTVPVYFVGPGGLYREFVATTMAAPGLEVATAVRLSVAGAAADPDYGTRWPAGARVEQVRPGDVPAVDIVDASGAGADPLAVQQVVYTVTAVLADLGAAVDAVRLSVDGTVVGDRLARGSTVDTVAPLWLISPQSGARVATTFEVHLSGTVFEAAARLRVRDEAGTVVSDEPVMLDKGAPQRGEARLTLTLPPARYTIETYYLSLMDGSERALDDHTITVQDPTHR